MGLSVGYCGFDEVPYKLVCSLTLGEQCVGMGIKEIKDQRREYAGRVAVC